MYTSSCNLPLKIVAFVSGCIFWFFLFHFYLGRRRKVFVLSWTGWKREEAVIFISPVARLPFNRVWDSTICCCFQLSRLIIRRPEVLQPFKNMFCSKKVWMNPARFCRQPFFPLLSRIFSSMPEGGKVSKKCMGREKKENSHPPGIINFSWVSSGVFVRRKKTFFKVFGISCYIFLGKGYLCHFRTRDPVNDREELNSVEVNYPFWWRHWTDRHVFGINPSQFSSFLLLRFHNSSPSPPPPPLKLSNF